MEEKSGDEKPVVEERKEENEAKASVDSHVNKTTKEKTVENSNGPEKKLNGVSKKKEKADEKEKEKSSPERAVKKEKDTEEGGSAKKKPISSFFGRNFFSPCKINFNFSVQQTKVRFLCVCL